MTSEAIPPRGNSAQGKPPRGQKPPRVVAELGRPETLEETQARKAEQSRKYRANKTINNLWLSILVCVGLVIVIVLLVPRDDTSHLPAVDFRSVASSAQAAFPVPVAVPDVPATWTSNAAEIRTGTDNVVSWYVGLITPTRNYVGLTQGVNATDGWFADQVKDSAASSTTTIDGIQWTVYDNRKTAKEVGNVKYALTTQSGATTYIVFGDASDTEIAEVAASISSNVRAQPETAVTAK
ncbi:DUF4245 domain-containing protein [Subtercola sp. PAMC28395]|uniref:DUF4245 domain-containing protein n=1 Tax=Subtercola sp. PAMC28395 TaxID=2846775 RepID=UPI00209BB70C|nr:DUF4245 domain-containing protein [Subtercola sp. PAMC28395]